MLKTPTSANLIALSRLKSTLKNATLIVTDPDKAKRAELRECKSCYYLTRGNIAMQAFMNATCEGCECEMTFPNSITDKLCAECTIEYDRCKHCAGDINTDLQINIYQDTIFCKSGVNVSE